jgi:hypothetical protein
MLCCRTRQETLGEDKKIAESPSPTLLRNVKDKKEKYNDLEPSKDENEMPNLWL